MYTNMTETFTWEDNASIKKPLCIKSQRKYNKCFTIIWGSLCAWLIFLFLFRKNIISDRIQPTTKILSLFLTLSPKGLFTFLSYIKLPSCFDSKIKILYLYFRHPRIQILGLKAALRLCSELSFISIVFVLLFKPQVCDWFENICGIQQNGVFQLFLFWVIQVSGQLRKHVLADVYVRTVSVTPVNGRDGQIRVAADWLMHWDQVT